MEHSKFIELQITSSWVFSGHHLVMLIFLVNAESGGTSSMAEAIYWWSFSRTWSKGCEEPPGCSSKVIKFSISGLLVISPFFVERDKQHLALCGIRFLGSSLPHALFIIHVSLSSYLFVFITLVSLAQSWSSESLTTHQFNVIACTHILYVCKNLHVPLY